MQPPRLLGIRKRNSLDFVRRVFDAYRAGLLVVLLDEGQDMPAVPGHVAGEVVTPQAGGGWFAQTIVPRDDDAPAQLAFTSGTEGRPKGILLSHRALADVVKRLNAAMQVDSSIREYIGVPVTYSFGLGRCRAVAAAGGQFFLPEKGFDPLEIRRKLEAGEINAISAVPTLLRVLLQNPGILGDRGKRVKWIEVGSQYMSRAEKEGLKRLFPNAVIMQHYGLTEASRSTFLPIHQTEGEALESVGRPCGDVEVRIAADGRIQLRGPHLALGRLEDGALVPLADADGWLTTEDNGRLEEGCLFYAGRADDVINSGGIKVDPAQLEQEAAQALAPAPVPRFAIARIADPARGEGFLVAVEAPVSGDMAAGDLAADDMARVEGAVRDALQLRGIAAGTSVKMQAVDAIPVTGTGKVRRRELASSLPPEPAAPPRPPRESAGVLALYREAFRRDDIARSDSFQDLGGDSLNYVEMAIALEKELGQLPPNWDLMPVSQLERMEGGSRQKPGMMETGIALRALAITCVVAAHSGLLMFGGGTFLLFFLIGYNLARFKSATLLSGTIFPALLKYTRTLVIPYVLLAVLYMVSRRTFYPDLLFFYTNLVELRLTQIFPFWFVQVLVQCLALTGILLAIGPVRRLAGASPWPFALGLTTAFVALWAAFPLVWDTDHLRNLVPQRYIALLWLGWCCYYADTPARRFATLVLGLGFAFIDSGVSRNAAWIALGTVATLYVPMVRVPSFLRGGIQLVSAATFYIFALNGIIAWVLTAVFERLTGSALSPLVFAITFAACLAGYWIIERALERVRMMGLRLPVAKAAAG